MRILSHRGYWTTQAEKNQEVAFRRSFNLGYGTETDVRDCRGELVISHDMPKGDEMPFSVFLALTGSTPLPLAINIKADGLAKPLAEAFCGYKHDWFVFDMSIPDMRAHLDAGNPVYARLSEVERTPAWANEIAGVWLDAFRGEWYDARTILELLQSGLKVCLVSSELHKRDHRPVWTMLKELGDEPNLSLCTDIPEEATRFFL